MEIQPHLTPNVIMVDGNGQWHDRYAGLACFVGVKTGLPTIGVGKTFYNLGNNNNHHDDHDNGEERSGIMLNKNDIVRDVKRGVEIWYNDHVVVVDDDNDDDCNTDKQLDDEKKSSYYQSRALIVDNKSIPYCEDNNGRVKADQQTQQQSTLTNTTRADASFEDMLIELHQVGTGLAIPMRSGMAKNDKVLAYALIGHGGNTHTTSSSKKKKKKKKESTTRGSKNPIYISCGSHISLLDAVSLVAYTSIVSLPEPVREADLYGRQLLREREKNKTQ